MKIITLVDRYFWILENDDVICNPGIASPAALDANTCPAFGHQKIWPLPIYTTSQSCLNER